MVPTEMGQFIKEVYHTPYSLLFNNCFHKSIKIVQKAHELGLKANLVVEPMAITPRHTFPYLPLILPHCHVRLEGEKVDVAQDPQTEQVWCKNSEIVSLAPLDLPEGII